VYCAKSGPIRIIVAGCFVALCCSGCYYVRPRHGLIVRGDWSLELNRLPWLTDRSTTQNERSQSDGGRGCAIPPGGPPVFPMEGCGEASAGQPIGYEVPCPTGAHVTPVPGRRCLVCSNCGRHASSATAEVGYQNHSRFHPVPTRPVFSSRDNEQSDVVSATALQEMLAPGKAATGGPSSIRITPPAPVPEEIKAPRPEPKSRDRVTQAPRRLDTAENSSSWVFGSPEPGKTELKFGARPKPAGRPIVR